LKAKEYYLAPMEILQQLEQRIGALLDRLAALTAENASLKATQERELSALAQENNSLKEELDRERGNNAEALSRIEALIERIKEHTNTE
jgi:FtsZ-binding cell division protein ZapB